MYTNPRTPEQFLHNGLILVNAMHTVGLAIDIKVSDFIPAVLIDFKISNIVRQIKVTF